MPEASNLGLIQRILAGEEIEVDARISDCGFVTCYETPYGLLIREQGYINRIQAGECSYKFMVEIAESTLTLLQVKDLLQNMIAYRDPTPETMNLDCMVAQIIKAIDLAIPEDQRKPVTAGSCYGDPRQNEKGFLVWSERVAWSPPNWTGRGLKRYPQDYQVAPC